MMPHEETWEVAPNGDQRSCALVLGDCVIGEFFGPETDAPDEARARLAAQAPAMARQMLERLEGGGFGCSTNPAHYCNEPEICEGCNARAILRAAGVLP